MDREKALEDYQERIAPLIQKFHHQMGTYLREHAEELEQTVKGAIDELGEKMASQGKEYVSYLYISMLKTDVLCRSYRFLLHAMNLKWYLDEETIEVYFDAGNLMGPFDELWDRLEQENYGYMGAVNQYDIQHIMFGQLREVDSAIAHILRYRLRDWKKKELFSKVTLPNFWLLKWGEYRDRTEIILYTDQEVKEQRVWKSQLKEAIFKPETMVFSYWYQGDYEDCLITQMDMRFMVMEECVLKDFKFLDCNLEGARFTGASLTGCIFEGCNLSGVDFSGCTFKDVSFAGSEMADALLMADSVPFLNLSPEQLQAILLRRENG